jgi:hypothetical protein
MLVAQYLDPGQILAGLFAALLIAILKKAIGRTTEVFLPAVISFLASLFALVFFALLFVSAVLILASIHS